MNWLSYLPLLIKYGPAVKAIWDEAMSNDDAVTKIRALSAPLAQAVEGIGAELFPQAAPALHIIGGVVATFDPNVTAWLQKGLNAYLGTNLVVDGIYGPKTREAVAAAQTKLGLTADGIAGQITQAAFSKIFG